MRQSRTRSRAAKLLLISPAVLTLAAWILAGTMTIVGYTFFDNMKLLQRFMLLNKVDFNYSMFGVFWVAVCLFVYSLTSFMVMSYGRTSDHLRNANFSGGLVFIFRYHVFALVVTVLWIFVAAASVGGFSRLLQMAQENSYEARQLLLENKLFVGMRLLYASFTGTGAYGAYVLAYHMRTGTITAKERRRAIFVFVTSAIVLFLLPIIMSQRILLFIMVISSYVGSVIITGRFVGAKYMPVAVVFLFFGWSIPDYITLTQTTNINTSIPELGFQKIIFYFSNDLFNSLQPLSVEIEHTYGVFSTQFIQAFTLTLKYFREQFADVFRTYDDIIGGGTFPMFTAPYIDFGVFGLIFIAFVAFVQTVVFEKGKNDARYAIIYGPIGASLILGSHFAYYTHQNFWMCIFLFIATGHFMRDPAPKRYPPVNRRFRGQVGSRL